jgi:hypothetical protein
MSDAPTTAAATGDERYKHVTDPETGQSVRRLDFIRKCWVEKKMARGAIAKLLTELSGKKVVYQIVFAATKKLAGGPDKPAATAEATTGETAQADAA